MRALFVANMKSPKKRALLIGGSRDDSEQSLSTQLQNPRSIAVEPNIGIMLWTSWPEGPPDGFEVRGNDEEAKDKRQLLGGKIEVAWLDGTHRLILNVCQNITIWRIKFPSTCVIYIIITFVLLG